MPCAVLQGKISWFDLYLEEGEIMARNGENSGKSEEKFQWQAAGLSPTTLGVLLSPSWEAILSRGFMEQSLFLFTETKHFPRWLIHLALEAALLIAVLEKRVKTSGLPLTVEMISLARNSIQFPDPLFEQQTNKIWALELQAHLLHKYQEARGSGIKHPTLNNASSQSCYPLPWIQPHSISRLQ